VLLAMKMEKWTTKCIYLHTLHKLDRFSRALMTLSLSLITWIAIVSCLVPVIFVLMLRKKLDCSHVMVRREEI